MIRVFVFFTVLLIQGSFFAAEMERFVSKGGHFSVQPPQFFNKPKVHQEKNEEVVFVSMIDDMGTLFRIEYFKGLTKGKPSFAALSVLVQGMTRTIKGAVPGAEIIEQELLELGDKGMAFFCLYHMPNGSVLLEKEKGRFDSMRGVIFFLNDNQSETIISYQTDLTFICPNILLPDRKEIYNRYRSTLIDAARSFRVEK